MDKKVGDILQEVLNEIKPEKEEVERIRNYSNEFLKNFNSQTRKLKINAEAFVGGSFAKKTIIKKRYYDVDIFVRFDKKYKDEEISDLTEKILKSFVKKFKRVHGSRDYFNIQISPKFFIEIIPVMEIKNPKEARNVTDLSYSHVKYVNKKAKGKLIDEILLAKAFCHANKCYGAESYINGFSGYSLELLICYYKSFIKFIKEMVKDNKRHKKGYKNLWSKEYEKEWENVRKKIIIDIEKLYPNKESILMDVNNSKLKSPIILIDPTFKQRNVAAALNQETFERFKDNCIKFLKNPSEKAFEEKETDFEKIKNNAVKNKREFILIETETEKQEGDIAGSKLLKFYNHLNEEVAEFFEIKNKGFDYDNGKNAKYFFVVKRKKELIKEGPPISNKENVIKFKKAHKKTFVKNGKIYARDKINFSLKQFLMRWKEKNSKKMREMSIKKLEIID